MKDIKKGDLINVQVESARNQFKETGDFTKIVIESQESEDVFGDLASISKMQIYKIAKNDLHKDLAKYGVNVGHYTLEAIKVESLAFPVEGEVKVNGEHDISFKTSKPKRLSETYFLNEAVATAIATGLNMQELEKMKELNESVEKAVVMLDQIVEKAHV